MDEPLWTTQRTVVLVTSSLGLLALCVPFLRALRLYWTAHRATRRIPRQVLSRGAAGGSGAEPLALVMTRVLGKSLAQEPAAPGELVLDASKQFTIGEYETYYARPLCMYANLLPPVGLTGNAIGMLILLVSKHVADAPLELAALGLAMISTITALCGYALLEALRLGLYGRLLRSLDEVVSLYHSREAERTAPGTAS